MSSLPPAHAHDSVWRLAIDNLPFALVMINDKEHVVHLNPCAERVFGYERDELVGQSIHRIISRPNEILDAAHAGTFHPAQTNSLEDPIYYANATTKHGKEIPIELTLRSIDSEQGVFAMLRVGEMRMPNALHPLDTDQSAMERLMIVGQLAAGVAHEIRTPLSVIRNDVYFLQSLGDRLDPEANEAIQEISEVLGRANRIVSELLDFTRTPIKRSDTVKLSSILTAALTSYRLPSTVQLHIAESIEHLLVDVNSEQIERVLINLLRNAVQAMGEKGAIKIDCGEDSAMVWLDVADNGPGISESDRRHVFDPLFSTKSTGIGLGLTISLRYAKSNDGDLRVLDRPDEGACFRLTLPKGKSLRKLENDV